MYDIQPDAIHSSVRQRQLKGRKTAYIPVVLLKPRVPVVAEAQSTHAA